MDNLNGEFSLLILMVSFCINFEWLILTINLNGQSQKLICIANRNGES